MTCAASTTRINPSRQESLTNGHDEESLRIWETSKAGCPIDKQGTVQGPVNDPRESTTTGNTSTLTTVRFRTARKDYGSWLRRFASVRATNELV